MSENATSDLGTLTEDFDKIHDGGADFKSSENEKQEGLTETETNVLNTGEIVSGCKAAESVVDRSEVSANRDEVDAPFQPRAASLSFVSDSTENSFVTEEAKYDYLPAENFNTDTEAAGRSEEQEIPATETDPFIQSVKYLEKHQILRLFQNFAAQIVYKRPEKPLQYLVEELERRRGDTTDGSTETQDSGLIS